MYKLFEHTNYFLDQGCTYQEITVFVTRTSTFLEKPYSTYKES